MKIVVYKSRGSKEFRWTLYASNGKKFATAGESFKRHDHLLKRLGKVFPGVKIEDKTVQNGRA